MIKKRILALLLAVSMVLPSVLPASAAEPQRNETQAAAEEGTDASKEESSGSQETGTSDNEPSDSQKETSSKDDATEHPEETPAPETQPETPEPESETDAPEMKEESPASSYKVSLDVPEFGTLSFPMKESEIQADEKDPWTPMQEALKEQEEMEKGKTEQDVAPNEEVTVYVSSDYGYQLTSIQAVSEKTKEAVMDLKADEEGKVTFQMPEEDIRIQAAYQEIDPEDPEKEAEDQKAYEEQQAQIANEAAPARMMRAAAEPRKSIYLYVPSSKLWYGSYNTRYYTTNENKYAYCIEPRRKAPKAGYYSASVMYNTNVRKAAYYAYGGPGYSKFRSSYGNIWDGSQKNEYIYSHIIISYIYAKYYLGSNSEANFAFYGLNSTAKNKLIAKANNLLKLSAPPSSYTCYTMATSYKNGNNRSQAMLCQTYNSGTLSLKKVSSNTAMTNGNSMYSLNGAQYGVYSNSGCTSKVGTLTTNANGVSNTLTLNPGTYYIKEIKAPLGYELSKTVTKAVVPDGGTKSVTVSDDPIDDPAAIIIKKLDRVTGEAVQGGASLAGAQFTIKYYDGLYTKENLPANAARTWVIETKEVKDSTGNITYRAGLSDKYKVSGDAFYKKGSFVTIPRGTVTIQETKAPEGYENNLSLTDQNGQGGDDLYLVQVQKEGDMSSISGGNVFEGTDTVMRGDFSFTKKNGATNKIMANIPFKITNVATGESHTVYTDENGYFSSQSSYVKHSENTNREQAKSGLWFGDLSVLDDQEGALPFGEYSIEELRCSNNADLKMYKGKFTIDQNGMVWEFGTIVNSQIEIETQVIDTTIGSSVIGSMNDEYGYFIGDEVSIDGLTTGYAEMKLKDKTTGEYIKDAKGNDLKAGGEISEGYGNGGMATLGLEVPTEVLHTLQGKTVVSCVRVYALNSNGTPNYNKLLGAHEDLDDLNETLYYPSLETKMTEKSTNLHDSSIAGASVLEDTVKVQNIPARFYQLESSFVYQLVGTLVDQNGTPVKGADGKNITASTAVKQMSDRCFDDTFTLTYNVPESVKQKYAGQTLHSFVELWGSVYGDQDFLSLIAFERDVKNPSQTISLPIIESTNVSKDILEYDAKGIKDKVNMKGLTIGQTYTLEGQIVDPTTGQVIVQSRSLTYGKDDFDYQYVIPGAGANYSVTKSDTYGIIFQTEDGYFRLNEDEVYVFCEADGTQLGVKTLTRDEFESELFPGDSFEEERPLSGYYFFTAEEKDVEKYVPFSFNIETLRGKKYVITEKLYHGKGKTALPLDTTDDYTITLHGKGTIKNGAYVDGLRLGFSHKEDISFNIGAIQEPNGLTNPRFYFEVNDSVMEAEQLDYDTLTQSGSSDKKHFDVYVVYQQDYSMLEYQQNDKSIFATKGFDITKATDVVYGQRQDSPKGAVDISAKGTGTVMAYYEGTVLHVDSITPFAGKHEHLYPAYPENCSYLYSGFSNLTSFDFTTSNANTEFMKDLMGLFYNCPKLTTLNVTDLVNSTNKVESIFGSFMQCPLLTSIKGLDTWNVENVDRAVGLFMGSTKIENSVFDQMRGWNLKNCTMMDMFLSGSPITNVDFMKDWKLPKAKTATAMFNGCKNLVNADLSDMFGSSLEDATNMFLDCTSLKSVNLGATKLSGLKSSSGMFARSGIESIDLSGLFGTKLENCENMFLDCKSIVTIDLSDNPLYSVKNSTGMFARCSSLKTIYVSNDFTGLTASSNMFLEDRSIVGGSGVKFNTAKIDKTMANCKTGYLTLKGTRVLRKDWLDEFYKYAEMEFDKIILEDRVAPSLDVVEKIVDVSEAGNNSLQAYYDKGYLHITTNGKGPVILPEDCSAIFESSYYSPYFDISFYKVDTSFVENMKGMFAYGQFESLDLSSFDTRKVTDMSQMFYNCESIVDLDLSNFKTYNVKNMQSMFEGCTQLSNLNVNSFNVANVTNMENLFSNCTYLSTLNLSNFHTKSVKNMCRMFYGCENLYELNIASFDTSIVEDMNSMFNACSALESLDVSMFNTEHVKDMRSMFRDCASLMTLNLSNFKTVQVEDMSWMFDGCFGLSELNISNFDTSQVKDMSGMFSECRNLTSLNLDHLNTDKTESMRSMFEGCTSLSFLSINRFNTENVKDMHYMFSGCSSLTNLELSMFDTSNVTDMNQMFTDCSSLTNLNINNFNTRNVTDMYRMFGGCSLLVNLDVSNFDTGQVTDMSSMFSNCSALTTLDLSNFDTSQVTGMSRMFSNCSALTTLDLSNFDTSQVTDMSGMFSNCSALTTLDLSNFDTRQVIDMSRMFYSCSSLKKIYVSNLWSVIGLREAPDMFFECTSIIGGSGVKYNPNKTDLSMANWETGYLTIKAPLPPPFLTLSSSVGTKVADTVENVKAAEDGTKKKNVDKGAKETMSPKTAEEKKTNPVVGFFRSLFSADAEPKETKEADVNRLDLMDTHNDLNDEKQTFYVANIQTELTNANGEHYFTPNGTESLTDKVTYSGLKPNQEYTLTGQLINKDTGAVVVEKSVTFTPSATKGTVNVPFSFDASSLGGVTLVAYETLSGTVSSYGTPVGTYVLAEHKDKDDAKQTVTSMSITTSALDKKTSTKMVMPDADATVLDTVSYKGAVTGQTYCLEATLMQKYKEEAAIDSTGKTVTGYAEFTPTAMSGSQTVELNFDATSMPSGEYVVFEKLYALNGDKKELWTVHEDYNDAAQTITITGIDTNIYEATTLTNMAYPKKDMEVHDIVTYTGFEPGETYTLDWKLVDVATKKDYVDAAGKTVKKTQNFTPDEPDGEFEVVTTFDGSKLNGQNLTAVITVRLGSKVLFEHNHTLDNEYETLSIPGLDTVAAETRTGAKEVYAMPNLSVTDKITYKKLQVGLEHIVKTSIVDKKTGKVLQNNKQEPLTFESEIAPDQADGVYDAVLEFDGSGLGGVEAVVFQEIWLGDTLIAQHKDLNDADQTFTLKEIPKRTADVVKRIKASDFHKEHGDVTFLFKMDGTDVCGDTHTYYREITFTEEYVKANTVDGYVEKNASFEQVPMGTYTVSEEESARYYLTKVENVKNAVIQDKTAQYDLTANETACAKFTNAKYEWQDYSDSCVVTNHISDKNEPVNNQLTGTVELQYTNAKVGNTIIAIPSIAQNDAELDYQWYRKSGNETVKIAQATAYSYRMSETDLDKQIICQVSDSSGKYQGNITSDTTEAVQTMPRDEFNVSGYYIFGTYMAENGTDERWNNDFITGEFADFYGIMDEEVLNQISMEEDWFPEFSIPYTVFMKDKVWEESLLEAYHNGEIENHPFVIDISRIGKTDQCEIDEDGFYTIKFRLGSLSEEIVNILVTYYDPSQMKWEIAKLSNVDYQTKYITVQVKDLHPFQDTL